VLPLANFGKANFDPTVNGGAEPNFDTTFADINAIQLVDPYGETSNPFSPGAADAFSADFELQHNRNGDDRPGRRRADRVETERCTRHD